MGSWVGTCQLSGLPIEENEEIFIIPVALQKETQGTFIFPEDPAKPICTPILGRYDGYGGIKDTEKLCLSEGRHQRAELMLGCLTKGVKYAPFHRAVILNDSYEFLSDEQIREQVAADDITDVKNDIKDKSLNGLISDIIERDRMVYESDLSRVGLIYIKKSIYKALSENYNLDNLKERIQLRLRTEIHDNDDVRYRMKDNLHRTEELLGIDFDIDQNDYLKNKVTLPRWAESIVAIHVILNKNPTLKVDYHNENFLKNYLPLEDNILNSLVIDDMMKSLGKTFMPTSGKGCRHRDTTLIEKLAIATVKDIQATKKKNYEEGLTY